MRLQITPGADRRVAFVLSQGLNDLSPEALRAFAHLKDLRATAGALFQNTSRVPEKSSTEAGQLGRCLALPERIGSRSDELAEML